MSRMRPVRMIDFKAPHPAPGRPVLCRNRLWPLLAAATLCLSGPQAHAGQSRPDRVEFEAAVRHTWDDNYNRQPDEKHEQVTVASAGLTLRTGIRQQILTAGAGVARHEHQRRTFLDATTHRAQASWSGPLGPVLRHHIGWNRYERPADRADFDGKDIITFDTRRAGLTLGSGPGWQFPAGVRQETQDHSSSAQQALNFEDLRVHAGVRYVTGRRSSLTLEMAHGEREYPDQDLSRPEDLPPAGDLDYDYTEAVLRGHWVLTDKTHLEPHIGYFQRDGEVNEGTGAQAGLDLGWQMTTKTRLDAGYHFTQPPVGETSNSPSDRHNVYLEARWQATPRLGLGTRVAYASLYYESRPDRPQRTETLYHWSPLTADYQLTEHLELTLTSRWLQRESPRDDREFTARDLSLGLRLKL